MKYVEGNLRATLEGMVRSVFGAVQCRWVDAYFPFTDPSLELEILFEGNWLEVLGCGMIHRDIMASVGLGDHHGYAFGLGLERLAMVLYGMFVCCCVLVAVAGGSEVVVVPRDVLMCVVGAGILFPF